MLAYCAGVGYELGVFIGHYCMVVVRKCSYLEDLGFSWDRKDREKSSWIIDGRWREGGESSRINGDAKPYVPSTFAGGLA